MRQCFPLGQTSLRLAIKTDTIAYTILLTVDVHHQWIQCFSPVTQPTTCANIPLDPVYHCNGTWETGTDTNMLISASAINQALSNTALCVLPNNLVSPANIQEAIITGCY